MGGGVGGGGGSLYTIFYQLGPVAIAAASLLYIPSIN